MEKIWYAVIENNNAFRREYIRAIKAWDKEGIFIKLLRDSPFIAVYYNDRFLGAKIISDEEGLDMNLLTVNGSIQHYDEINKVLLESHHRLVKKI